MSMGSVNVPWHVLKKRLANQPKPLSPFLRRHGEVFTNGKQANVKPHLPGEKRRVFGNQRLVGLGVTLKDPVAKSRGKFTPTDNGGRKLPEGYAGKERLYFGASQEKKRKRHFLVHYS